MSKLAYLSLQQFLKLCRTRDLSIVTGKLCPKISPWLSDDTIDTVFCCSILTITIILWFFSFWLWELPGHMGQRSLGLVCTWPQAVVGWGSQRLDPEDSAGAQHSWVSVRRLFSLSKRFLQLQHTSDTDQIVECHLQGSWFITWSSLYTVFGLYWFYDLICMGFHLY